MGLNLLYSHHQLSLIRAASAASHAEPISHLDAARVVSHRIREFQLACGAAAAHTWAARSPAHIAG